MLLVARRVESSSNLSRGPECVRHPECEWNAPGSLAGLSPRPARVEVPNAYGIPKANGMLLVARRVVPSSKNAYGIPYANRCSFVARRVESSSSLVEVPNANLCALTVGVRALCLHIQGCLVAVFGSGCSGCSRRLCFDNSAPTMPTKMLRGRFLDG